MTEELRHLQQEFDKRLSKDSQGLVVPDPRVGSPSAGAPESIEEGHSCTLCCPQSKDDRQSWLERPAPVCEAWPSKASFQASMSGVGSRGLKERTAMEEALKASVHRDSVKGDNDGKWVS